MYVLRIAAESDAEESLMFQNAAMSHVRKSSTHVRVPQVIRLEPPMLFSKEDADFLVDRLDVVLGEDFPSHNLE